MTAPPASGVWRTGEDVQVLDNALAASTASEQTRRAMLGRASAALLAGGIGTGALLAGCGSSSSTTPSQSAPAASSGRARAPQQPDFSKLMNVAVTAEALAVTYLSAVIERTPGTTVQPFADVLKAANASEFDHYQALKKLGAKPATTRFWIPEELFGPQLLEVFTVLEIVEALFVDLYLIATTAFAQAGNGELTRYAVEISAVEAEHLALARYASGRSSPYTYQELPNDLGFTYYGGDHAGDIIDALRISGVGFGERGDPDGRFYHFAPPPPNTVVSLRNRTPS